MYEYCWFLHIQTLFLDDYTSVIVYVIKNIWR